MASTPRYVGTDAATARAYLCAALNWSPADFIRVFDLDGDGEVADVVDDDGNVVSADESAFVRCVCMAETEVDEALGALGAPFVEAAITDSVREVAALRVPWCAVRAKCADPTKNPNHVLYQASDRRIDRLAKDKGLRIPGRPAPEPIAGVLAGSDPAPSTPWGDAAGGKCWSGF